MSESADNEVCSHILFENLSIQLSHIPNNVVMLVVKT